MNIVWSKFALEKLSEIARSVTRNREEADRWVKSIFDAVMGLMDAPEEGKIVPGVDGSEVRELTVDEHRIIYSLEKERINILTVRSPN